MRHARKDVGHPCLWVDIIHLAADDQPASIVTLSIEAEIEVMQGPDPEMVLAAAQAAIEAWADDLHRLGRSVRLSAIYAALHREGVKRVILIEPAADIEIGPDEAAFVSAIDLSIQTGGA